MILDSSPATVIAAGNAFAEEFGCLFGFNSDPFKSKSTTISFSDGPSYGNFVFRVELIFNSSADTSPSRVWTYSFNGNQVVGGTIHIVPADIMSFGDVEAIMRDFLESNGRVSMNDHLEQLSSAASK